jgi:trypsin-like peptidase
LALASAIAKKLEIATRSVLRVGDGRGFVVEGENDRLVITAAHCLPFFPPCRSFSYIDELTYRDLLGELDSEPTVWTECLFVDPVGDIAVLGPPDSQELREQDDRYQSLLAALEPIGIADAPAKGVAWLLSKENRWFSCEAQHQSGPLSLNAEQDIVPGMSGSPIVDDEGRAIGICCTHSSLEDGTSRESGPNPRLMHNLPFWAVRGR